MFYYVSNSITSGYLKYYISLTSLKSHTERYLASEIFHCQSGKGILFSKDMFTHQEVFLSGVCQLVYEFNNTFFNIFLCLSYPLDGYTAQREIIYLWVSGCLGTNNSWLKNHSFRKSTNYWIPIIIRNGGVNIPWIRTLLTIIATVLVPNHQHHIFLRASQWTYQILSCPFLI